MTDKLDVYEAEGELLDMAAQAAINERPFYMQKQLDSLTDQVHLLDHITIETQNYYFADAQAEPVQLPHTPAEFTVDVEKARAIALDENGNLRQYSSFPRHRSNIADDHEIHSYTADGE